jgi:hypothetical protein
LARAWSVASAVGLLLVQLGVDDIGHVVVAEF